MLDDTNRTPFRQNGTVAERDGAFTRSRSQILLLLLSIEKVLQHLLVTYAFAVDLGDIRSSVVIHHVPLMIVGFVVGEVG